MNLLRKEGTWKESMADAAKFALQIERHDFIIAPFPNIHPPRRRKEGNEMFCSPQDDLSLAGIGLPLSFLRLT